MVPKYKGRKYKHNKYVTVTCWGIHENSYTQKNLADASIIAKEEELTFIS
jgi:hypothetical protein